MFPSRLILILMFLIATIGAALSATQPLYEQFRPLSSLPWAEPGVTREQVIRRLFREPNPLVRSAVLDEYLKTMPAAEFGQVFDLCVRLEGADAPDDLLKELMRAWARIDAAAAWTKCNGLYELIVTQQPLDVDMWESGILILNPRAVAAAKFWPRYDAFSDAFSEGVAESGLPQKEKDRYIARQKAKSEAWQATFDAADARVPSAGAFSDPDYHAPPPTPDLLEAQEKYAAEDAERVRQEKARQKFVLEILACPPTEIRARLAAAQVEMWDDAILTRALIRWMDGDARRGPEIVGAVLDLLDPHDVLRNTTKLEPVPIEFLVEWALLDSAGFRKWALVGREGHEDEEKVGRPGLKEKSVAVVRAMDWRNGADRLPGWVDDFPDDGDDIQKKNRASYYWAQIDPGNALPWIWAHGGVRAYGHAALSAVYDMPRNPNVFRAIFVALDECAIPIPDDSLYEIMEQWSDTDAVGCAKHGTRWSLRTGQFTKQRMIRLWTGYLDPDDGAVDDRHYGSLRIWAMRKPEEMRAWIRTERLDDDVRKALLWLVDHARGGYELRKDGSPPVPLAPPPAAEKPKKSP